MFYLTCTSRLPLNVCKRYSQKNHSHSQWQHYQSYAYIYTYQNGTKINLREAKLKHFLVGGCPQPPYTFTCFVEAWLKTSPQTFMKL